MCKRFFILISMVIGIAFSVSAQSYCDTPEKIKEVQVISGRIEQAFIPLGKYTGDKNYLLDTYNNLPDDQKTLIRNSMEELQHFAEDNSGKTDCILEQINSVEVKHWISFIRGQNITTTYFVSPNFKKGIDLLLDLNVAGVTDLFMSSESFSSSYGLLVGSTFKRKDPMKSRRLRYLMGGTIFYQQLKAYGMFSGRIEWKGQDLAASPVNAGCWKLFLQGSGNANHYMVHGGFGLELYILGVNVLAGYQNKPGNFYLQSGIFLNLTKFKPYIKS